MQITRLNTLTQTRLIWVICEDSENEVYRLYKHIYVYAAINNLSLFVTCLVTYNDQLVNHRGV